MATVDSLPPDQRAVLALLMHQRMSYADIATMLKLSDAAVRERAHGALAAIGPQDTELTARRRAEIGDWLLLQASGDERDETEGLLRRSAAAREWARAVARELRPLGGDGPPEVPGGDDAAAPQAAPTDAAADAAEDAAPASPAAGAVLAADPTAPPAAAPTAAVAAAADARAAEGDTAAADARTTEGDAAAGPPTAGARAAEGDAAAGPPTAGGKATDGDGGRPARSSRAGGAVVLAGIALVAVVLVVLLTGGDDDGGGGSASRATQPATRTADQDATPQVVAQVNLRPPKDSPSPKALGVVQIVRANNQQAINAVFDGLPKPTGKNVGYGIWLWSSPQKRKWLGFLSTADEQGRLVAQGRFDEDITAYRELLLTRESRRDPPSPGTTYLRGRVQRAPR